MAAIVDSARKSPKSSSIPVIQRIDNDLKSYRQKSIANGDRFARLVSLRHELETERVALQRRQMERIQRIPKVVRSEIETALRKLQHKELESMKLKCLEEKVEEGKTKLRAEFEQRYHTSVKQTKDALQTGIDNACRERWSEYEKTNEAHKKNWEQQAELVYRQTAATIKAKHEGRLAKMVDEERSKSEVRCGAMLQKVEIAYNKAAKDTYKKEKEKQDRLTEVELIRLRDQLAAENTRIISAAKDEISHTTKNKLNLIGTYAQEVMNRYLALLVPLSSPASTASTAPPSSSPSPSPLSSPPSLSLSMSDLDNRSIKTLLNDLHDLHQSSMANVLQTIRTKRLNAIPPRSYRDSLVAYLNSINDKTEGIDGGRTNLYHTSKQSRLEIGVARATAVTESVERLLKDWRGLAEREAALLQEQEARHGAAVGKNFDI